MARVLMVGYRGVYLWFFQKLAGCVVSGFLLHLLDMNIIWDGRAV